MAFLASKGIDISKFISLIKAIIGENTILSDSMSNYYGKITVCFENGRITHIEKYETIK